MRNGLCSGERVGPVLYSTNPWFAGEVVRNYRGGQHVVWVSPHFDATTVGTATSAAMIAASSNPKRIYDQLLLDCRTEDTHSALIRRYKSTFRRLARTWLGSNEITRDQCDEILASVDKNSWRMWRPCLYVIPRANIDASRIKTVPQRRRAALGPEQQIFDLMDQEFDRIEIVTV